MHKGHQKKLLHILPIVLLLLAIVVGLLHSPRPFPPPKAISTINPAAISSASSAHSTPSPSLETTQPLAHSATRIDSIANATLLGIFWWLSSCYTAQLGNDAIAENLNVHLTFKLKPLPYILAALAGTAMLGYIGYLCYQKYSVDQLSPYLLASNISLCALVSMCISVVCSLRFFERLAPITPATGMRLSWSLLKRIFTSWAGRTLASILAISILVHFTSQDKRKNSVSDRPWLFSILISSSIWTLMVDLAEWPIATQALWAIPVCFVYVQTRWPLALPPIGPQDIGGTIIAWLFQTSHLWTGLGAVCGIYYLLYQGDELITKWLILEYSLLLWACVKCAFLDHLEPKKAFNSAYSYGESAPLGLGVFLEGSATILWVAFGLCWKFWPDALATPSAKICYGASVLAVGLWIRMYFITHKRSNIVLWRGLLTYGLLSIGGSGLAAYYAYTTNHKPTKAVARISLLLFGLYVLPKRFNHIATTALPLINMPRLHQIAATIQDFTAFWLQPNVDIVCTAIVLMVTGIGCIHQLEDNILDVSTSAHMTMVCLIALRIYLCIEVDVYHLAIQQQTAGILTHLIFGLSLASIVEWVDRSNNLITCFARMLYCCFFYLTILVWIQSILNISGTTGYQTTPLPIWYSLSSEDMYAIGFGLYSVLVQVAICSWLLNIRFFSFTILLLIFTLATQLTIFLKLARPFRHKHTILSCFMVAAYYAYVTKVFMAVSYYGFCTMFRDTSHDTLANFDAKPFAWFFEVTFILTLDRTALLAAAFGFVAAIVVDHIQHIALSLLQKIPVGKLHHKLDTAATYISQRCSPLITYLKPFILPA